MDVSSLLQRLDVMRDSLDTTSREDYEALNVDIHMGIWTASDNERLKMYLMELWNGPSTGNLPSESLQHYRNSTFEHISILHFIQDREPENAKKAMTQHIARSMQNVLKRYD